MYLREKAPSLYLRGALQQYVLLCPFCANKNEGGTNKATALEPSQHLLCQQREVAPNSVILLNP